MPKLALNALLLSRHASSLEGAGRGHSVFRPRSEPRFGSHGIMVLSEECLEILGVLRCPPSRLAHDRSRGLSRVTKLLRLDADAVQTFVRGIVSRLSDLTTKSTPPGADQDGKKLTGPVLGMDVAFAEHKGRTARRRMKVIEEQKVAIVGEDRRDPSGGLGPLTGKLRSEFIGSALEQPCEDVSVAASPRADPSHSRSLRT